MTVDTLVVDPDALAELQFRAPAGGSWAVYQNIALDSSNAGHLQFLKFGTGCTFATPPEQYPADTEAGAGWRYRYVGIVDLVTGKVVKRDDNER